MRAYAEGCRPPAGSGLSLSLLMLLVASAAAEAPRPSFLTPVAAVQETSEDRARVGPGLAGVEAPRARLPRAGTQHGPEDRARVGLPLAAIQEPAEDKARIGLPVALAQEALEDRPRVVPGRVSTAGSRSGRSEQLPYSVQLTPPGPLRLFGRRDSEEALRDLLRNEALSGPRAQQIEFPPEYKGDSQQALERDWNGLPMLVAPHYVCHKRLFFEQPWSERCAHRLGVMQPIICAGIFFGDVFTFPLHLVEPPWRCFECHSDGCSPFFDPDGRLR